MFFSLLETSDLGSCPQFLWVFFFRDVNFKSLISFLRHICYILKAGGGGVSMLRNMGELQRVADMPHMLWGVSCVFTC